MSQRVLIAGIGNVFHGDDAFGVEVANELARRPWPEAVRIIDFGIRSYDLAFALTDSYENVILIDAFSRGEPPGTLFLIKPDLTGLETFHSAVADAHSMNPLAAIQMALSLGELKANLYLLGCEPAVLENADGELQLSQAVAGAVPQAISLIESLVEALLSGHEPTGAICEQEGEQR